MSYNMIPEYVSRVRESNDVDEQLRLLDELNTILPISKRLRLPSFITRDYISKAVNTIEESWLQNLGITA